jgi:hypothetical protein
VPRTLVLHVGTPKSGTTHLQAILARGRERLGRDGVLYPGAGYLPRRGFNQQPAIYALAGSTTAWADDHVRRRSAAYFEQLREELDAHPGRALVSVESLAFFDVPTARELLATLGYDPSSVTVVITARDFGRILPSIWQQNVKNGSTQELEPYLDSVASLRGGPTSPLWTAFGLPGLAGRWTEVLGDPRRVVLVTAPRERTATDVLWERFAEAADIPVSLVDEPGEHERAVDNFSVTAAQAELIRVMNGVMQSSGYDRDRQQRLRGYLLDVWMNLPSSGGRRPAVPGHLHDAVRRWAKEDVAELETSGIRVVGSLADLEPCLPASADAPATGTITEDTARDVLALLERTTGLAGLERMPAKLARALYYGRRARAVLSQATGGRIPSGRTRTAGRPAAVPAEQAEVSPDPLPRL